MRTLRTREELRQALAEPRRAGRRIGLVATMGALHEGHLALMRRARERCDLVVVSLFVNPTQFAPGEDLAAYPRDEAGDLGRAASAGVDLVFAPAPEELYPPGFGTWVQVDRLTEPLEGAVRGPEHFRGVATVVLKLLHLVGPDVALFGQKDAQQVAVIRRMVRDLDVDVEIEVAPTVREPDGLALSSRNAYLSAADRPRARALAQALGAAERVVGAGEREARPVLDAARAALRPHDVDPDYLALVDPVDLHPVDRVDGEALLAVAARVGPTRLIDNAILRPPTGSP